VNGSQRLTKPAGLRVFDRVAVVAPAGPVDRGRFDAGLRVLAERYRPAFDDALFARARYVAGDDGRRLDELTAALTDETVGAVFAARGGYGTMRLLPRLWPKLKSGGIRPKPVIGFSDLTALHLALQAAGWMSIHGPTISQLGGQPPEAVARLFHLLESPTTPAPPLTGTPLVGGVVEGPLLGGNLALLSALVGTPYLPAFDEAVLLLEDVGERPYRLDRMWTQLAQAGVLDRVRAIALGDFTDCEEAESDYTSAEVLRSLVAETGLPCIGGLAIGHGAVHLAVPLGGRVRLDGDRGMLEFLGPAVAP
jgi:muramoyltetrapeptide carboxypeptidase